MIDAKITRDERGVCFFTIKNHGDSYVCSAVSMLVINTINSIETLAGQEFDCEYDQDVGYIELSLTGCIKEGTAILLDAMQLGLTSVKEQYPNEIQLTII